MVHEKIKTFSEGSRYSMTDHDYMDRALALAERGRGHVEPNPLVGAVIVREGKIVAEGWHEKYGQAHAEVNALNRAGEAARGATLYVTLEPCCHHGKTPPCTDALLGAGILRVVVAMQDPFPRVSGAGIRILREAGVDVELDVGGPAARRLNAPYLRYLRGKPWIHAKWAMTLDGKIATFTGSSKWITSEAARRRVHELRGRMDGIIVGRGTLLADDPLLTARPAGPRVATRIVLTSAQQPLPDDCRLLQTIDDVPVLVISPISQVQCLANWAKRGCTIAGVTAAGDGRLSIQAVLEELGRRGMTNVLIEGGSNVLGSFLDAGAIDEVHAFVAPKLVGGSKAGTPIGGAGIEEMANALALQHLHVETLGPDVLIHGFVRPRDASPG